MRVPVGFRHGPKSLINDQTLVLVFGSIDPYTRQYDLDLVREVGDQIARQVVLLTDQAAGIEHVREVLVEVSADSLRYLPCLPPHYLWSIDFTLDFAQGAKSPRHTLHRLVPSIGLFKGDHSSIS